MLTTLQVLPLLLLELLYAAIYVVTWVGASYLLGGATTPILFGLLGFMFFFMLHDYETRTLRSWASSTGSAAYWLTRYALTFYLLPLPGLILSLLYPHLTDAFLGFSVVVLFFIWTWWRKTLLRPPTTSVRRGTSLIELDQARNRAANLDPTNRQTLPWGGIEIPATADIGHFCVVGAPGSGKTVTLKLLMQALLPSMLDRSDCQALLYDAKRDIRSYLDGLAINCPIHILNPFDARCAPWDLAKDITSPASALQLATTFIPEEEGPNRFFSDAGRAILTGVFKALIRLAPRRWTLRDVLYVVRTESRLRDLLSADPDTADLIDEYFQERRTFHNVKTTISARLAMYEPIAALWSRSTRPPISLEKWVSSNSILILGNDESLRAPMDTVNRLIFQRTAELILAQPDSDTRRTWVFLDELKEAGRLDILPRLMTNGRSKGARVLIGFQDIEGLRSTYGEKLAHELTGICANKAFLWLHSEPTTTWASAALGEAELLEVTSSFSTSETSTTHTLTEHIAQRQAVLSSELRQLPPPANGAFHGFYIVPTVGVYRGTVDFKRRLATPGKEPDFEPRPPDDQHLAPWTDDDLQRLGLKPSPTNTPSSSDTPLLDSIPRITRGPVP